MREKSLEIDVKRLAALVMTKRAGRPLRVAAEEAGVAPATILRVERGEPIDLERFARICRWLKIKPELIFLRSKQPTGSEELVFTSSLPAATPDQVAARLRQDGLLSEIEITGIAGLIKAAYDRAQTSSAPTKPTSNK